MRARFGIFVWWLLSVALVFVVNLIGAAIMRQPPFTDWGYMIGMSLLFPTVLIFLFRALPRGKG